MKRKTYKKEYQVESILDKQYDDQLQADVYLIKWVGYPHSQNTWEPIEHLSNPDVQKMVLEFEKSLQKPEPEENINEELLKQCLLQKLTEFLSKHVPNEDDIQEIILSDFSNSSNQNKGQLQLSNKTVESQLLQLEPQSQFQKVLSSSNYNS